MVHNGCIFVASFTRLGHECQDLLSPCDRMHVCTDYTSIYALIQKSFGGMESEPMLTPMEKSPPPEKFSSQEDRTHNAASSRTASPTLPMSYSGPLTSDLSSMGIGFGDDGSDVKHGTTIEGLCVR